MKAGESREPSYAFGKRLERYRLLVGFSASARGPKSTQMRRDQVINACRELHLGQVAAAGEHDKPSMRQHGSEQFSIPSRRAPSSVRCGTSQCLPHSPGAGK